MKLYGKIPYVVVCILAFYGHKFVESINPGYDGTPTVPIQRHRRDHYIPPPSEGHQSDIGEPEPCLITLNIKNKKLTDRIHYRRNEAKKTDTFIARQPFIFHEIRRNNDILWKAENDQYFPKVVVKETETGESFFRIYYNNEATESEIEYDSAAETTPRNDHRTIHQSVPVSGHPSVPEPLANEPVIPVITVDLGYKQSNQYFVYETDGANTREMYTTNKPYMIKKVVQDQELLWQAKNGMYAYRVLFKQEPEGPKLKVFFPEEHENVPGQAQQMAGQVPQQVPGQYPQQVPGQYPQQVPGQYPQQVPGQYPQEVAGQYPQQVPGQYPQQVPGQYPQVPGQYPQQVPGQYPQVSGQYPQQMPEPARKTKVESDSDMDFRIVSRSDRESPTEGRSDREFQGSPRPYYRTHRQATPHSGTESHEDPRAHPQARVQQPGQHGATRHAESHPGAQRHGEPQFRSEPIPIHRAKPQPRIRPEDRRGSVRDLDYPTSAEPDFEPKAQPQYRPAAEPTREPRAPYEHFSEPEMKSDSDRENRRRRRSDSSQEFRIEDRREARAEHREEPRHVPGPPKRQETVDSDERRRRTRHIPLESDGPEETRKEMPEPEFRPVSPTYEEPVALPRKKIPIALDIEFKFTTYLFDYQRHNNLGTYTPKENFIFAKIRRNDKFFCYGSDVTIWQTNDLSVYSTKVNVIADTRLVIHLNTGKTLFYKRGFDSMWFRVDKASHDPIDWNPRLIDLDLGSRRSTQYYEFYSYSKYISRRKGTYLFVARERFRFKMVYKSRKVIWRAYSEDECAYKVGMYQAFAGAEYVTVFLVNGKARSFMRHACGFGGPSDWHEDKLIPGYGRTPVREQRYVPGSPDRTGISLNLPAFTGQIKDKLTKWYNAVDFSKLYNRNLFNSNSQDEFHRMAQFHDGDAGDMKTAAHQHTASQNRTFAFDDDDDDERPPAEFVNFNGNNNNFIP